MTGSDHVFIQRRSADHSTWGHPVYVTGPHFGSDIYSSTEDPNKASVFTRTEAQRLIAKKWRGLLPELVDAP
jgi:hypothetical protein